MTLKTFLTALPAPLRYLSLGLLLPLLLLALLLFWLLFTSSGAGWLLGHVPVNLSYTALGGSLWRGLELDEAELLLGAPDKAAQTRIFTRHIEFRWQPLTLMAGQVDIQKLENDKLLIQLPDAVESEPSDSTFELPDINLPVSIHIDRFSSGAVIIEKAGKQQQAWPATRASVLAYGETLKLGNLNFTVQGVTYTGSLQLINRTTPSIKLNADSHGTRLQAECQSRALLDCRGTLSWADFSHPITGPVAVPTGDLDLHWQSPLLHFSGHSQTRWDNPRFGLDSDLQLEATLDIGQGKLDIAQLNGDWQQGQLALSGEINWHNSLTIGVQGTITDSELALGVEHLPTLGISSQIDLQLGFMESGMTTRINADALTLDFDQRPLQGSVALTIDPDAIRIDTLNLQQPVSSSSKHQHIRAHGQLALAGDRHDLQLDLQLDDLSQFLAAGRGSLNTTLHLQGPRDAPDLQLSLHSRDLLVSGCQVKKASLETTLNPGFNPLAPPGLLDMPANLQIEQLQASAESLQLGELWVNSINTRLSGNHRQQQLGLTALGINHQYDIRSLQAAITTAKRNAGLQATIDLNQLALSTTGRKGSWKLVEPTQWVLAPDRIQLDELCLQHWGASACVTATLQGLEPASRHQASLSLSAQINGLDVAKPHPGFEGLLPLRAESWRGEGEWQAAATGSASLDLQTPDLTPQARIKALKLQADAGSEKLLFRPLAPDQASLKASASTAASTAVSTTASTTISTTTSTTTETDESASLDAISLSIGGDAQQLNIDGSLSLNGQYPFSVKGNLQQWLTPQRQTRVELAGDAEQLRVLQVWLPQVQQVKGSASLNATLRQANAAEPLQLQGQARINDFGALVVSGGTRLSQWQLTTDINREQYLLNGEGLVGSQSARLQLSVTPEHSPASPHQSPQPQQFSLEGKLTGQKLALLDLPDQQMQASPDLRISGDQNNLHLHGSVRVDRASLHIEQLPASTTETSIDARVYDWEESATNGRRFHWSADLGLDIADQVNITALGLQTSLMGQLRYQRDLKGNQSLQGLLTLPSGKYEKYGQDLTIDQGKLIFSGPVDNPALDIRAARVIDTVTVGIWLTGTAKHPKSQLYSTPSMPEAEILSYLLTGKPLSAETNPDDMQAAAINLGLTQLLPGLQAVGGKLGIDELGVEESTGGDSLISAGKWINERLLVKYVYGVMEAVGRVVVQYQLTDSVKIETSSGQVHSADIIYTWNSKLPEKTTEPEDSSPAHQSFK